jgi:alpha-tubulin suppressor-like RCC1 family protein
MVAKPVQLAGLSHIKSVTTGFHKQYALDLEGSVWEWGNNESGELGIGSTAYGSIPSVVGAQITPAVQAKGSQTETPEAAAKDQNRIKVTWNEELLEFDQDPILINEKTMVPLRKIFETIGASMKWNADTQTVTAVKGNRTVSLTIGDETAYINGSAVILEQPAQIVNERTLVPIRFISESFNAEVIWDGSTKTIHLTGK